MEIQIGKNNYEMKRISEEEVKSVINLAKEKKSDVNIMNFVDYTSLHTEDTKASIKAFTEKANKMSSEGNQPAAICVYPSMVETVKNNLTAEGVVIAAVAGGFPHSQTFTEVKVAETLMALQAGATEIDIVMPLGKLLNDEIQNAVDEINELKECCKDNKLKVILESGSLDYPTLYKSAMVAMEAGADFIKTSTGKQQPAATPEAAVVMCMAIKDFYEKSGRKTGFKAAGGIKSKADAKVYYNIVGEILGKEWQSKDLFRIGASNIKD